MAKYPGQFIINEVGTRKELAELYGVSERTIYRWLNKAAAESGAPRIRKSNKPSVSKLSSFKGTRKQAAQKFGVSERTIYRWMNDAKLSGTSTTQKSKYFGPDILNLKGTNKQLAVQFGVSDRTISRWKAKARLEIRGLTPPTNNPAPLNTEELIDQQTADAYAPENMEAPPEIFEEPVFEQPIDMSEDLIPDEFEDYADFDISDEMFGNLKGIYQQIEDNSLVPDGSIFNTLTYKEKMLYINNYLMYQYDQDPSQFYDPVTHKFRFDTEWVTNYIDIWGDEFDEWANNQFESDMYEV